MPQSLSFEPIQEPARTPFPSGAGGEAARHLVGCSRVAVRAASDHAYRILTGMCLESMRPLSRGHGFFKSRMATVAASHGDVASGSGHRKWPRGERPCRRMRLNGRSICGLNRTAILDILAFSIRQR